MSSATSQTDTPKTPFGGTSSGFESRPEMTSSVSPGSRKPTSRPVSAKTMKHTTSSAHGPAAAMIDSGSRKGMSAVWTIG